MFGATKNLIKECKEIMPELEKAKRPKEIKLRSSILGENTPKPNDGAKSSFWMAHSL